MKFGVLKEWPAGHYRLLSQYLPEATMTREPTSLLDEALLVLRKGEFPND